MQLRRCGIPTVLIGGIASNMGVESTARQGYERACEIVIAKDATASMSAEMQNFAVGSILPMISRVAQVDEITLQG